MLTLITPSQNVGTINLQTFKPAPDRSVATISF